jgi:hypothetical protein
MSNGNDPSHSSSAIAFEPTEPQTTVQAEPQLSVEEQRDIAGARSIAATLSSRDRLDNPPPRRGLANAAIPRTFFVLGLMGTFCLIALSLSFLWGGQRKVADVPSPPLEPLRTGSSETDALKTKLALVGQGEDAPEPELKPQRREVPNPPKTTRATPPIARPTRVSAPAPRPIPATPAAVAPNRPEPEVDPFELWNQLASAGRMQGEVDIQPEETVPIATRPREVRIASTRIEGLPNLQQQAMSPPETIDQPPELSSGAVGILQRRRIPQRQTLPMGASAEAIVTMPLIWTAETQDNQAAVELQQPLKDSQGQEVLPAGTTLVTQVMSVDEESRLVEQTAIAIIENQQGRQVQRSIEPGVIMIRDRRQNPLQADRIRGRRGFNLGRGLSRAAARAGDVLSSPNTITSTIFGDGERSTINRRSNSGEAIVGGAVSGLFGELADATEVPQERQSSRTTALMIKEGERVSVVVNRMMEIER